ncbi:hypothetical protein MIND_01141500 [Mycena indigotica]|uniref:Uncharacterized protein n=1 Tax=Mycena indigotica TaxID=2126181 RepID=A0A8H6S8A1_9AGAR|nr:uncharacterized protein MIND_01141500 [Mycena indigotica]KAF7293622.1 hypothetical protein MIND_01141500 [Mycena indigotica]
MKSFGNAFAFMMRKPKPKQTIRMSQPTPTTQMEVDSTTDCERMEVDSDVEEILSPPVVPPPQSNGHPDSQPNSPSHSTSIGSSPAYPEACMDRVNLAHVRLREMLEAMDTGRVPTDLSLETAADRALNQLHHRDFPSLRRAAELLELTSKNKHHDVVFRTRLAAMLGTLNLFLNPGCNYTWRQASTVIARSQGHATHYARRIRDWLHYFLTHRKLPEHVIGVNDGDSLLDDEDFCAAIKLHLQLVCAKNKHFRAQDIVDFVAGEEMQAKLEAAGVQKRTISVRTARRYKRMDWRFGKRKNGMYVDGHEREDVVAYRTAFVKRWIEEYEPRIIVYDNEGNEAKRPDADTFKLSGKYAGQRFQLIPVTHDESTFYKNDRRKSGWIHASIKAAPEAKGEGDSIMVSDFLVAHWGRLRVPELNWDARLFFRAGKNRDGYFTSIELLEHVENAIDIFEHKTHKFATGLFLFDNAPSHQKRAARCAFRPQNAQRPPCDLDSYTKWSQNA